MVKCSRDQVNRLKKALQREKDPIVRQRIQMILLREDGKTQPDIAELTGVSLSTVLRRVSNLYRRTLESGPEPEIAVMSLPDHLESSCPVGMEAEPIEPSPAHGALLGDAIAALGEHVELAVPAA